MTGCARKVTPGPTAAPTPPAVPAAYQQMYSALEADLNAYDAYLDAHSSGQRYNVTCGAELITANSNRGEDLLKGDALQGVIYQLDRFQELGIGGVTVAVSYPIYSPDNPRYEEYVSFFDRVADEVRKRDMKLDVEVGVVFANTPFANSGITADFKSMTYAQYMEKHKRIVQAVIDNLHPDYVNIGAEPDTACLLTGYKEFNDPAQYAAFVNFCLDGLDRGGTQVGAGMGSWGDVEYARQLAAQTSLDNIVVHVYPVFGQCLENLVTIADIAGQHNKGVVLDECWLNKEATPESGNLASDADVFRRDTFSFWAPLDQRFIGLMAKTAKLKNIQYISPFWSNYLFSYLDYGADNADLPYAELAALNNRQAAANIVADRFSPTGEYYRRLIDGSV